MCVRVHVYMCSSAKCLAVVTEGLVVQEGGVEGEEEEEEVLQRVKEKQGVAQIDSKHLPGLLILSSNSTPTRKVTECVQV